MLMGMVIISVKIIVRSVSWIVMGVVFVISVSICVCLFCVLLLKLVLFMVVFDVGCMKD